MHTPFVRSTTKFDAVTHTGRGLDFSGLATPRSQRGGAPVLSDFKGSSLSVTILCKACVIILILENEFLSQVEVVRPALDYA